MAYRIQDDAKLRITDAQGKLVWQTELKANSQELKANSSMLIPSQTFANGLYFYTLQSALGSARGKIVVQR